MPPSRRILVVQPLPGIGDMVWHLPHIRALARHFGGSVTLVAKPRSHADEIFAAEDTVTSIIWLDRNPNDARGIHDGLLGLGRLIRTLRTGRFDAVVLLHNSSSLAFATWAAGIPSRQGYGIGLQRWFLNRGPYLTKAVWQRCRPMERATLFLQAGKIPIGVAEPRLPLTSQARITVERQMRDVRRPLVAVGIGSSESARQWGAGRFAGLVYGLINAGWPTLVLIGGCGEEILCRDICDRLGHDAAHLIPALGWHLAETAALLAAASFYVGNDTGIMNMAAAVGTRAYALFGMTPPLRNSTKIVPILSPPGGPVDGVARVSVEAVLQAISDDRGSLAPGGSRDVQRVSA